MGILMEIQMNFRSSDSVMIDRIDKGHTVKLWIFLIGRSIKGTFMISGISLNFLLLNFRLSNFLLNEVYEETEREREREKDSFGRMKVSKYILILQRKFSILLTSVFSFVSLAASKLESNQRPIKFCFFCTDCTECVDKIYANFLMLNSRSFGLYQWIESR